jgi:hypothetical protein
VDLEYANRLLPEPGLAETMQVWVHGSAPASFVDRLRAGGVDVISTDTVARRIDRYAASGPGLAVRFQLLTVVVGLLLAAGTLAVVAAVERPVHAAELAALRAQGVGDRVVRAVAYGGYPVMAGVFGGLGVVVAAIDAASLIRFPVFPYSWAVLPPPPAVDPLALAGGTAVALAVLGAVAVVSSAQLLRAVRRRRWSS